MASPRPSRAAKQNRKVYTDVLNDTSDDEMGLTSYDSESDTSDFGEQNAEFLVAEEDEPEEQSVSADEYTSEGDDTDIEATDDELQDDDEPPAKRQKNTASQKLSAGTGAVLKKAALVAKASVFNNLFGEEERLPEFIGATHTYKAPKGPEQQSASKPAKPSRKKSPGTKHPVPSCDEFDEVDENYGDVQNDGEGDQANSSSSTKADSYYYRPGIDETGVPLTTPLEIVNEICQKLMAHGLKAFMKKLGGRPLTVGTLCAGSESPVLGMKLVIECLKKLGIEFKIAHKMSAEIVPFKQAYIERNFSPEVLFRDITDFIGGPDADGCYRAFTAYGSKALVPALLDILICGFSCVDFSGLSSNRKTLQQSGESGDTFLSLLTYISIHTPKLVIVENIVNAPWSDVKFIIAQKLKMAREAFNKELAANGQEPKPLQKMRGDARFKELYSAIDEDAIKNRGIDWYMYQAGYFAIHVIVDTKAFGLPQTRQRGYMLGINIEEFSRRCTKSTEPDVIYKEARAWLSKWVDVFTGAGRWASVPVDVMLAASADDAGPGLSRIGEIVEEEKKKAVPWVKCKVNHSGYRDEQSYGEERPLTKWNENGAMRLPDHWAPAKGLTERVLDTLDTAHIRNGTRDIDDRYYNRYLELSQNVYRVLDTIPNGIIGCLTPTGIPWITSSGRRLTGRESLLLQGLDVSRLELSNLTEANMQHFTGNAMSLPVVTSAIMAALLVFGDMVPGSDGNIIVDEELIRPASTLTCSVSKMLNPTATRRALPVKDAVRLADLTVSLCDCEGRHETISKVFKYCTVCGYIRCLDCCGNPSHHYKKVPESRVAPRLKPSTFEQTLLHAVPPKLVLRLGSNDTVRGFISQDARLPKDVSRDALYTAYEHAFSSEVFLENVHRGESWKVFYQSSAAKAVLTIGCKGVEWLLYAQCESHRGIGDPLRVYLASHPIARMRPVGKALTSGNWEIWQPNQKEIPALVTSSGHLKPSFRKYLGVTTDQDRFVFDKFSVEFGEQFLDDFEIDISGTFELSQNCAQAFNTLHRKTSGGHNQTPLFFFFDHVNLGGDPSHHPFVFTLDQSRMQPGQYRQTIATLWDWKQPQVVCRPVGGGLEYQINGKGEKFASLEDVAYKENVKLHVDGSWRNSSLSIKALKAADISYQQLSPKPVFEVAASCATSMAVMTCEAKIPSYLANQYTNGEWIRIESSNQSKSFRQLRWALQHGLILDGHVNTAEKWHAAPATSNLIHCQECAPDAPPIYWAFKYSGKGNKHYRQEPFERPEEAAEYESRLKHRPNAISCLFNISNEVLKFHIEVNPTTLIHRAVKALCPDGNTSGVSASWLLATDDVQRSTDRHSAFGIKDSRDVVLRDSESKLPTKIQLRPEQRRCVGGMVLQENNPPIFTEEMIVEGTVPKIGYRLWGKASRQVAIKGGLALHPVGFGKTAIILGLAYQQRHDDRKFASIEQKGAIRLKATLIFVPPNLWSQWAGEVEKFLGISSGKNEKRILVLEKFATFQSKTIQQMMDADIIIVNWNVMSHENYVPHLAQFSGMIGPDSKTSSRAQSVYHDSTIAKVEQNVDLLRSDPLNFRDIVYKQFTDNIAEASLTEKPIPSKRVTGADYVARKDRETSNGGKHPLNFKEAAIVFSLQGFAPKQDYRQMKGLPLEAYNFRRVVVDEFTYMEDGLRNCLEVQKRDYTWMLSATPNLDNFESIRDMAHFLGINLGVVDYPSLPGDVFKKVTNVMTESEKFHIFEDPNSPAWNTRRHLHAQEFLDLGARCDLAIIGDIPTSTHYKIAHASAAETASYAELNQVLASNNFDMPRLKHVFGNRLFQLNHMLNGCRSYGEALLKHPILFNNLVDSDMADLADVSQKLGALALNSKVRSNQYKSHLAAVVKDLQQAIWLSNQSQTAACGQFKAFIDQLKGNNFGDSEVSQCMLDKFDVLSKSYRYEDWILFYSPPIQGKPKGKGKGKASTKTLSSDELPPFPQGTRKAQGKVQVAMVYELRSIVSKLCSSMELLVSLARGYLFMNSARICQQGTSSNADIVCHKCHANKLIPGDVTILSECGHILCGACRANLPSTGGQCSIEGCRAVNMSYQKIPGSVFNIPETQKHRLPVVSKKLEDLVSEIQKKPDEKVLVFIQQEPAILEVQKLLKSHNITSVYLSNNDKSASTLAGFQKSEGKSQVLILNIGNASAAGANLTIASRVFFVSPYYTVGSNGQRKWESAMEQARGRAVRFGQTRTVEIIHFFTAHTFEVDLFEHRTRQVLYGKSKAREARLRDREDDERGSPYSSSTSHMVLGGYE